MIFNTLLFLLLAFLLPPASFNRQHAQELFLSLSVLLRMQSLSSTCLSGLVNYFFTMISLVLFLPHFLRMDFGVDAEKKKGTSDLENYLRWAYSY